MEIVLYLLFISNYLFEIIVSILNYRNRNKEIPDNVKDVYNNEEYRKWLNYFMENIRLMVIQKTVKLIYVLVIFSTGLLNSINNLTHEITDNLTIQSILFIIIFFSFIYMVNLLCSFYICFSIEERYGFNKTNRRTFVMDKIKVLLFNLFIFGGAIFVLVSIYYKYSKLTFPPTILIIIIFVIFSFNLLFSKLSLISFDKVRPIEDGELKEKIKTFTKIVGYDVRKIGILDESRRTTKPNALISGFGKIKKVILFDTLLDKMSHEEIISVLAHEIGHDKHWHAFIQSLFVEFSPLVMLIILDNYFFIELYLNSFGLYQNMGISVIILILLFRPIILIIIVVFNLISRLHEYQADKFVLKYGYFSILILLQIAV